MEARLGGGGGEGRAASQRLRHHLPGPGLTGAQTPQTLEYTAQNHSARAAGGRVSVSTKLHLSWDNHILSPAGGGASQASLPTHFRAWLSRSKHWFTPVSN